ncbi:glycoside hydrolase family 15 protein [Patescibacteria group bacterium]|nr:glycoside hydrolase family 15 protein [Patescibacteria group bacterium]
MYKPIRDYAIIGNLRSAALVSKEGSVDWAPAPYLNSPSVFAALLDEQKGGSWSIAPTESYKVKQEYLGFTNILVTRFTTDNGVVEVVDYIPAQAGKAMEEREKAEVHRKITCTKGTCEVQVIFAPRFDYARGETTLSFTEHGLGVDHEGTRKGELISPGEYAIYGNVATGTLALKEGESAYLAFHYHETTKEDWADEHYEEELKETKKFWEDWVHRCDIKSCPLSGPWHDLVVRSSLVLKILFFEPPGSIAAAPTTSLPEAIGGVRNWDYRFSWIRDSSFTLQALFQMGYVREARAYVDWLLDECCSLRNFDPKDVQIMYGLQGEVNLREEILPHFEGYRGSKPVRIGNSAHLQKQWDIYGSMLDTVWRIHLMDESYKIEESTWNILRKFANYVVEIWRQPDEGLWEVRGGRQHFVYSKVMCWVALDRAIKIAREYGFEGEVEVWEKEKEAIFSAVMKQGWSEQKQSFVQSFGSQDLDASLLLMPVVGFINGKDKRMISTIKAIENELSVMNGLLLRYTAKDGLPGREGAFLPASFWLIDALIFAGEKSRARVYLASLTKLANHVGLYSEEINPKSLEFLGNFPQAYTHIGLINSAFYLYNIKDL